VHYEKLQVRERLKNKCGHVIIPTNTERRQIVNSDRAASMRSAVKKDIADVSTIPVLLNLTMPPAAAAIDELASKLWLYADSQNKVNTLTNRPTIFPPASWSMVAISVEVSGETQSWD